MMVVHYIVHVQVKTFSNCWPQVLAQTPSINVILNVESEIFLH